MSKLFNNNLTFLKKLKQIFLWAAVTMLIGSILVGAIVIVTDSFSNAAVAKLIGTLSFLAVGLFVSVNNLSRIIKGNESTQILAIICFFANIMCLLLGVLMIWEVVPMYYRQEVLNEWYYYTYEVSHLTIAGKLTMSIAVAVAVTFISSNMLIIKNNNSVVRPLKIAALSSLGIAALSALILIFTEDQTSFTSETPARLYGFASSAVIILWIVIAIVAKASSSTKKIPAKTEEELRAEIRAQVMQEINASQPQPQVQLQPQAQPRSQTQPQPEQLQPQPELQQQPQPQPTSTTLEEAINLK